MPARILPSLATLLKWRDEGLTHDQIADRIEHERGYRPSRSTISAAFSRAGENQRPLKKFPDEIPWTVKSEHASHYAARMLRLLGRRRRGIANSAENESRLDYWLAQLHEQGAVVVYVPDTDEGFFYVKGTPDDLGIPVQREFAPDP